MFKWISKSAAFVFQVILVVAAVLVFSYFDPFGLLSPTRLKLKDTPIQIRSIKEIGELTTAEYYGEVIASLDEVVQVEQDSILIEFKTITENLHQDFIAAITTLRTDTLPNRKEQIYERFKSRNPDIVSHPEFEAYLYYVYEKIKDRNYNTKDLKVRLDENSKQTMVKRLYLNRGNWYNELVKMNAGEFQDVKEESIRYTGDKKYKRSRLVIIGRGWVKAGFDFGEFTDRNFRYDNDRYTIHFIGLQPKILVATINPWFIPEEGVEGFEFLIAERGARLKPEYVSLVKKRCLDKLQLQAMQKDILIKAQKNAEHHLRAFFSILLEKEIKSVLFHTDQLEYTLDVVRADSVLRNEEIITIENTLVNYNQANLTSNDRFTRMAAFVDSLKTETFEIYEQPIALNAYTALLFNVVRNRMIDSTDVAMINQRKQDETLDSLWLSRLFAEEDAKKNPGLSDSLTADAKAFATDLDRLIKSLEVDIDSAYFGDKIAGERQTGFGLLGAGK